MVSEGHKVASRPETKPLCSGLVFNREYVLTSAYCVDAHGPNVLVFMFRADEGLITLSAQVGINRSGLQHSRV